MLLLIAQHDEGLEVKEICDRLDISRQVAYHMLHTLTDRRVVSRNQHGRYIVGLRIATLARGLARQVLPANELAPIARRVAKETGEISFAAGEWEGVMTNFYIIGGTQPISVRDTPYQMEFPHSRAAGKLLLAMAAPHERDAYLAIGPLKRVTERTITSRRVLEQELALVREQKYATEVEESAHDKCSLAVPIDEDMTLPFCIGLTAPTERYTAEFDNYLAIVRQVVASERSW
jgi:IclR family acetate operon transcriptional repressor